jgi:hypothetical protein
MKENSQLVPGDVCLVIADVDNLFPEIVGQECMLLSGNELHRCLGPNLDIKMVRGYAARLQSGHVLVFARCELRKRNPPAREMARMKEIVVASFNGRTADCRSADRGSIPRVTATG